MSQDIVSLFIPCPLLASLITISLPQPMRASLHKQYLNCYSLIVFFETDALPRNVNPLSVSVQSSGKKSSFLNLRLINKHPWKQRVKFEDLKIALNFLDVGHFMLLFDIKSG